MSSSSSPHIVLFFSHNTSLRAWDEVGMFDREIALYKRLHESGIQVTFVTYGDATDLQFAHRIPGIRIVCNRFGLPDHIYARMLTRLHPFFWRGEVVFKSNQVKGSEIALKAARRSRKPFVARCGYLHSDFMERQHGPESSKAQSARDLEQKVFSDADRVVVTTEAMRKEVIQRYSVPCKRVSVIPNHVDTRRFKPGENGEHVSRRICFVGRLIQQKNLFALLEAIRGLEVELLIVGNDVMKDQLEEKARAHSLPVRFLGNVPNNDLPAVLKSASLFVLPSLYEGHPKALLEAMACGLPVVGTDVPGIRELIHHGENGWLCGTSSEEIRRGIETVLNDANLQVRLGRNAREFVAKQFSLEQVTELELKMLEEVVNHSTKRSFLPTSNETLKMD